jgi:uncharacterized protein DUF4440
MKPGILLLVLLAPASLTLLHGQTGHKRPATPATASAQQIADIIQHLENEMRIATMKGDAGWFEQHLAENYAETDADGKVSNRAEVIQFYRTTAPEYDSWNLSEGTARTYNGNTVILTGKLDLQGTVRGQHVSGSYRVMRVWIKQGLDWQLASSQYTRIAG